MTLDQIGFFDGAASSDDSIDARFAAFDAANPQVFELLRELAFERLAEGRKHYGIAAMWEDLRYEIRHRWEHDRGFKLNDHYRSRYARKLMDVEPRLAGFFELRKLRSA